MMMAVNRQRKGTHMRHALVALVLATSALLIAQTPAQAMYRDGPNLYQYVRSAPIDGVDWSGMGTCHIWAYLPADRTKAGDLFLYCADGKVRLYAPVRGMGHWNMRNDPDRTKRNANTPVGDYEGKIEGPKTPNDEYGKNDVIRMTGTDYSDQPQISGELADRAAKDPKYGGRGGLLIHGGRQNRGQSATGTVYNVKDEKWESGTIVRPMGTAGCMRLGEGDQKKLMDEVKSKDCCCDEIFVHVREEKAPDDPRKTPVWHDPRKVKPVG